MKTVYLIGLPGSGKTSAMKAVRVLAGAIEVEAVEKPIPYLRWPDGRTIELGRDGALFSGTDRLAMDINPKAVDFMGDLPAGVETVLGEGDRLANGRFLHACPNLTLVHLRVPPSVARRRSNARAEEAGRPAQDETWWRGRLTKIENLCATWGHLTLDGYQDPETVAADLWAIIQQGAPSGQISGATE